MCELGLVAIKQEQTILVERHENSVAHRIAVSRAFLNNSCNCLLSCFGIRIIGKVETLFLH